MDELNVPNTADAVREDLQQLLARRERIEDWLARLTRETGANERVVARVRNDYLRQLREVLDAMAQHRDALHARARALREQLNRARIDADEAMEVFEEGELRHRIGEFEADEWNTRRSELERKMRSAREHVEELEGELQELDRVLQAIEDGGDDDDVGADELTLDAPRTIEKVEEESVDPTAPRAPDSEQEDLDEDDFLATRPGPGVKCPRCGYKNDPGAMYCGVCGIELA